MDCEDECLRNESCPKYRRRVRAGQPPADIDMWLEERNTKDELSDLTSGLIVAVLMIVVALFAFGWVALL